MKLNKKDVEHYKSDIIEIGCSDFKDSAGSFLNDYINKGENETGYIYFGCFAGEIFAGYLLLSIVEDEGEVIQLAVNKGFRRKGFSTVLLNEVFSYCEKVCVKSVFLEVRISNSAAVSLYEKNGFIPIGKRKDYYSNPTEDAFVMKRMIENSQC